MADPAFTRRIEAVRRFSRFHTRRIGVLHEGLLAGELSLTEGRVVYELARTGPTTAARLGAELGLDPGYLSRILRGLETGGLIERRPSPTDGRQSLLSLTSKGRDAFAVMDARSTDEVGAMLQAMEPAKQDRLVAAPDTP